MSIYKVRVVAESIKHIKVKAKINGHEVVFDTSHVLGGTDVAPSPIAYLTASYAACLVQISQIVALNYDVNLENVNVEVLSETDTSMLIEGWGQPPRIKKIIVKVTYVSNEPEEKLRKMFDLVKLLCPITNTLKDSVEIIEELIIKKIKDVKYERTPIIT